MTEEDEAPPVEEGAPAWMATFGDMMSLLLTFFVLILSFANMDVIKFSAAVGSLRDAFGTQQLDPGNLQALSTSLIQLSGRESSRHVQVIEMSMQVRRAEADLMRRLELMIAAHDLEKLVEAEKTDRGVVVRVRGALLFDPGSADLRAESLAILDEIAELVAATPGSVAIEGHTDDSPIRTREFPSNWHLSADRAIAALQYMVAVAGIEPRRLTAAGHAHHQPLAPNDGPEHRDENRRVEFVFLRPPALVDEGDEPAGRGEPPDAAAGGGGSDVPTDISS